LNSESDPSKGADTLPRAELNPLLNPLLAQNLGRWAEVYFTSTPEAREEAVSELLHVLEAENADSSVSTQPHAADSNSISNANGISDLTHAQPDVRTPKPAATPEPGSELEIVEETAEPDPENILRCKSCGHDNPESYLFCGSCGGKLEPDGSQPSSQDDPAAHPDPAWHHESYSALAEPGLGESEARESQANLESSYEARRSEWDVPGRSSNTLSLFQSGSSGNGDDEMDWHDEAPSNPYRLYIGTALAVVIVALVYMGWRAANAGGSHEPPPAPPVAATEETTPPSTASPATGNQPDASPAAKNTAAPAAQKKPSDPGSESAKETSEDATAAKPAAQLIANAASSAPNPAVPDTGQAELATAQGYLNSKNGAEAAQWLWKSVAKHNNAATLLLADLYLRGDGVSRNCDQARVLLDAAARKGVAGAGERLRNLQAFGCQ
jgi:hypothetical protein